jgi:hypothetical protein
MIIDLQRHILKPERNTSGNNIQKGSALKTEERLQKFQTRLQDLDRRLLELR